MGAAKDLIIAAGIAVGLGAIGGVLAYSSCQGTQPQQSRPAAKKQLDGGIEARVRDAGATLPINGFEIPDPETFDRWMTLSYHPSPEDASITHIHRTIAGPLEVHVVEIDMAKAVFKVTPQNNGYTVSEIAGLNKGALAVVNGDHFCPRAIADHEYFPGKCPSDGRYLPAGISVSDGWQWQGTRDYKISAYVAFSPGRIEFHREPEDLIEVDEVKERLGSSVNIISGAPMLVYNGAITKEAATFHNANTPLARTGIGASRDMRRFFIVTVNGREGGGMTCPDFARYMLEDTNAHNAMELSYGDATSLYVRFSGGLVNKPSGGKEQKLANHLIVYGK